MTAAAVGALGGFAMRPGCATVTTAAAAPAIRVAAMDIAAPPAIASFPEPAAAAAGRNVFAFASASRPRPSVLRDVAVPHSAVVLPTPQVVTPAVEAKPAYRYLGAFGPQDNPILVYKGNGDVVNVTLRQP